MKDQSGSLPAEKNRLKSEESEGTTASSRVEEQMDVAEPDAPTSAEENDGMSTILDADPISGVQNNASDE